MSSSVIWFARLFLYFSSYKFFGATNGLVTTGIKFVSLIFSGSSTIAREFSSVFIELRKSGFCCNFSANFKLSLMIAWSIVGPPILGSDLPLED